MGREDEFVDVRIDKRIFSTLVRFVVDDEGGGVGGWLGRRVRGRGCEEFSESMIGKSVYRRKGQLALT
jgi:hypothetical protein